MLFQVVENTYNQRTVTAEVASSSLVVPAISFKHLEGIGKNCHGPVWSKSKEPAQKTIRFLGFFGPILVQELSNCRLLVQHHPYNLALCQSFLRHSRLCVQIESDPAVGVTQ